MSAAVAMTASARNRRGPGYELGEEAGPAAQGRRARPQIDSAGGRGYNRAGEATLFLPPPAYRSRWPLHTDGA